MSKKNTGIIVAVIAGVLFLPRLLSGVVRAAPGPGGTPGGSGNYESRLNAAKTITELNAVYRQMSADNALSWPEFNRLMVIYYAKYLTLPA